MTHLTEKEILEKLESERLMRLWQAGANLKSDLVVDSRCPLCTLKIPCKHFKDEFELFNARGKFFKKQEWQLMSQDHRNAIIKMKLVM